MPEYIREVEKTIDNYHQHNRLFALNRSTALFNALTVFEDACRLGGSTTLTLTNDQLEHSFLIREQLDALNVLVQWIFEDCPHADGDLLDTSINPKTYMLTADALQHHAKPYSPISSAYISYSRGQFKANIDESNKRITFVDNPNNRSIVISDMMESILGDLSLDTKSNSIQELRIANNKLISSIRFNDGHITYTTIDDVWQPFQRMMEHQWDSTSELPEEWIFDNFSLCEFKKFWISLATFSFIHMVACLKSGVQGAAVEHAVIIKTELEFAQIIAEKAKMPIDKAIAILTLLKYDSSLKNNDIVYQPFVELGDNKVALAPHLILASRPERNLVSLLHKIKDRAYFDLTNLREGIMQDELDCITKELHDVTVVKNKPLPGTLPDVDYAIWDHINNCILICELKWLIEADSTPEVFARTHDLEHGCNQISDILSYANKERLAFCQNVFGIGKLDNTPEIIGCVVSKKGIRVDNSNIPVISLQSIISLLQQSSVSEAFESIRKKTFLMSAPSNFEFGLKTITYAGYTFDIPALLKDEPIINGTYRRASPKIGRNDPCPCGSGKKYKKCCGR